MENARIRKIVFTVSILAAIALTACIIYSVYFINQTRQTEQLLRSAIIPSIDFSDIPVNEALTQICEKATAAEPKLRNVSFRFLSKLTNSDYQEAEITLKLRNVPASEALRYTTALAQYNFEVSGREIWIDGIASSPMRKPFVIRVALGIENLIKGTKP